MISPIIGLISANRTAIKWSFFLSIIEMSAGGIHIDLWKYGIVPFLRYKDFLSLVATLRPIYENRFNLPISFGIFAHTALSVRTAIKYKYIADIGYHHDFKFEPRTEEWEDYDKMCFARTKELTSRITILDINRGAYEILDRYAGSKASRQVIVNKWYIGEEKLIEFLSSLENLERLTIERQNHASGSEKLHMLPRLRYLKMENDYSKSRTISLPHTLEKFESYYEFDTIKGGNNVKIMALYDSPKTWPPLPQLRDLCVTGPNGKISGNDLPRNIQILSGCISDLPLSELLRLKKLQKLNVCGCAKCKRKCQEYWESRGQSG